MAPLVAVSFALVACSRSLYDFPDINPSLKANQVNLIVDSSFEDPSVQFCVSNCRTSSGWSVEHTTALPPKYEQTKNGAVAGTYAEAFSYVGQPGGRVSLIWPHCDGLIWPHLRHAGAVL